MFPAQNFTQFVNICWKSKQLLIGVTTVASFDILHTKGKMQQRKQQTINPLIYGQSDFDLFQSKAHFVKK